MQKQQGRKALILLTDGVDEGSKTTLNRAIEAAQRSNTLVYSILYADPEAYGHQASATRVEWAAAWDGTAEAGPEDPVDRGRAIRRQQREEHPDGKKVLQRIARETGGRFFEVSKKDPIDQIYDSIAEELRNQYSIGYSPDKAVAGAGYHKIALPPRTRT